METQNSFKSLNPIQEEKLFHQYAKSELKRDSSLRTYNISTVDQEPFEPSSLSQMRVENMQLLEQIKEKDTIIRTLR